MQLRQSASTVTENRRYDFTTFSTDESFYGDKIWLACQQFSPSIISLDSRLVGQNVSAVLSLGDGG